MCIYKILFTAIEPTARQGSCCSEQAEEMLCLEVAPVLSGYISGSNA